MHDFYHAEFAINILWQERFEDLNWQVTNTN